MSRPDNTMQGDPDEGTPSEAVRMAEQFVAMVQRATGTRLGYDPRSLVSVDEIVDDIRATGLSEEDASGMIYAVGCYVGEVLVRHAGGSWRMTSDLGLAASCGWPIVVVLPDGTGCNPIGKAFRRFRNGAAESLAFFWYSTENQPVH
jgi:hypothetical protein